MTFSLLTQFEQLSCDRLDLSIQPVLELLLTGRGQLRLAHAALPLKVPDAEPADRAAHDGVLIQLLSPGRGQLACERRRLTLSLGEDDAVLPPVLRQRPGPSFAEVLRRDRSPRLLENVGNVQQPR